MTASALAPYALFLHSRKSQFWSPTRLAIPQGLLELHVDSMPALGSALRTLGDATDRPCQRGNHARGLHEVAKRLQDLVADLISLHASGLSLQAAGALLRTYGQAAR